MRGKRVGTTRTAGRRVAHSVHHQRAADQNNAVTRLVICGAVFVLIVALKFLLPQETGSFAQRASHLIGRDADFSEAFAAVGRAVSGEESVSHSLQEAFLAVFGSAEVSQAVETDTAAVQSDVQTGDLAVQTVNTQEEISEEPEDIPPPDASGIYTMQALPENASLEQRNLGFPYTTPVVAALSSPFGWRDHPTEGGNRFHYGIDLAAEKGSEIAAFADGEVFAVGESSTLGQYIILTHAGGYTTLYAHCSEVIVRSGSVKMGDVIARVGDSGSTTGAHLHFELQNGSLYLNPIYYVAVR
ncbi:MAG: M23 family metallopeptidase [Oscillospiraceae bacterium]|nr:M23 family metallopeptidase [Oscillospiraceae bacterium]